MYASVNQVSIGSGNDLVPIGRTDIIYFKAGLFSIAPSGIQLISKYETFVHKNAFENVVYEVVAICPGGDSVNSIHDTNTCLWHGIFVATPLNMYN